MNLGLSLASGVLLVVLFPRIGWTFLAPFALAPLLLACARESSWKRRFLNGWASGVVFWFFTCTWIQYVLEVFGGMGRWGGWGTFVLFAVLKGLYTGVFAALAGTVMRKAWAIPAAAALWVGIEYAHAYLGLAWIGLGFTWLNLGNAAIDMPILPRLAPVGGVYAISFMLAMMSAGVALLVLRRPALHFVPLAVLVFLRFLPGLPARERGEEIARVVQPNITVDTRWTTESFAELLQRMAVLSSRSYGRLIVWPEAPAPFYPSRPGFKEYIADVARSNNANFFLGAVDYTADGNPLNSAFLVTPAGEIADRYDKIQLVPFGEYIPPAFGWVNRITQEAGDFVPGTRVVTFPVNGHRIGAFICYESAFPALVRDFSKSGADVLMNLSNDGYFGDSAAREQHLALVRMRAVENRRWILRATNNGITAMIDPAGRVTERLPEHQMAASDMRFSYVSEQTPYARFGDWFAWSSIIAAIGACLAPRLRKPF